MLISPPPPPIFVTKEKLVSDLAKDILIKLVQRKDINPDDVIGKAVKLANAFYDELDKPREEKESVHLTTEEIVGLWDDENLKWPIRIVDFARAIEQEVLRRNK